MKPEAWGQTEATPLVPAMINGHWDACTSWPPSLARGGVSTGRTHGSHTHSSRMWISDSCNVCDAHYQAMSEEQKLIVKECLLMRPYQELQFSIQGSSLSPLPAENVPPPALP